MSHQPAPEFPLGNDKYLIIKEGRAVVELRKNEKLGIDPMVSMRMKKDELEVKREKPEQELDGDAEVGGDERDHDFYDEGEFDVYDVDLSAEAKPLISDDSTDQDN